MAGQGTVAGRPKASGLTFSIKIIRITALIYRKLILIAKQHFYFYFLDFTSFIFLLTILRVSSIKEVESKSYLYGPIRAHMGPNPDRAHMGPNPGPGITAKQEHNIEQRM